MPPLCDFICDVIRMSAEKQMIQINAEAHITSMADHHFPRNLAVDNFVSYTMHILLTPTNV